MLDDPTPAKTTPKGAGNWRASMRSVWNGAIRFSLVTFPVKLYSAFDSEKSISFNQLHTGCNGRVAYKKECRSCGEPLDKKEDIVKGYEYSKDQ